MVNYGGQRLAQVSMAQLTPSDLTRLALAGAHEPEIRTLAFLKDALPDDYTVFHGVHWSRQYKGATVYGEIDFIVMNRAGDVLLIEQKNGPLEEDDAGLHKRYGEARKSVGDQILRAVGNLKEKFRYQCGPSATLAVIQEEDRVAERRACRIIDAASRTPSPRQRYGRCAHTCVICTGTVGISQAFTVLSVPAHPLSL